MHMVMEKQNEDAIAATSDVGGISYDETPNSVWVSYFYNLLEQLLGFNCNDRLFAGNLQKG